MGEEKFRMTSDTVWRTVVGHVRGSLVFADASSAECLHWSGGISLLFDGGALGVKDFSSFEGGSEEQKKAVFLVTSPFCHRILKIIEDVVKNSHFRHCVVVTSADDSVHALLHPDSNDGRVGGPCNQLEKQLLIWMRKDNCIAKVQYVPIFMAGLCSNFFLTPPFFDLCVPMSSALDELRMEATTKLLQKGERRLVETLSDLNLVCLPSSLQIRIRHLVLNLHSLLEIMDAKEEIYNVGYFSRIVGAELEQLPQARIRRKTSANKVSVVFVDGSLDMAQATSYDFVTISDKIRHLLPTIASHASDVQIDISPLCSSKINSGVVVSGSLAGHPRKNDSVFFDSLFSSKPKEFIMELNRQLVDGMSKQNLSGKPAPLKPGRVNVETLECQIDKFRNQPLAIVEHAVLLQHALATVQATLHADSSKVDTLLGIEKALLQIIADSELSSSLSRLVPIVKDRKTRGFSLEDVLVLIVRVYVLAGEAILETDIEDAENALKAVLGDAVLADVSELPEYLSAFIGEEGNELSVHAAVEEMFIVLHAAAKSRENLKKYRNVLKRGNDVQPASYSPLVKQILDDSFDPSKPDLMDVECRTSGLKDRLKSGFGLFMNVNKPRPSDNQTIIVYIIGGTTSTEVRLFRETVLSHNPNAHVLVGSTRMSLPKDTLKMLFRRKAS